MDIFVFRHYIDFMRSATNLIVDSTYDSDISGSGNQLRASYRFSITNNFENNGETFVALSSTQYLLVGDGKYTHPNERISLDNKNEVILTLFPRNRYSLKLVQRTGNDTFYSNLVFTPSIVPLPGSIINIDPFDQAFRIDVSYNLHDLLQYTEYGIPITHVSFLLSHRENGGDIFEIQKEVSIQNINGSQKMQTQFVISNLDLSGYGYPENMSGIQNTFTYDINFFGTNQNGPGFESEAYPMIQPIELPDRATIRLGDQTLDPVDYFDTRMTLDIIPPFDFALYNNNTDLSAVHLRASTNEWSKYKILNNYDDISNINGFTYTWVDPSFVNGSTIEFSASYENSKGQGGITDTLFVYSDKERWSNGVSGIPFGTPNGVSFNPAVKNGNQIAFTWTPSTTANGTIITDPILYDISLIDPTTEVYVPNQYEFDLSINSKTFSDLSDGYYKAIVVQKNVSPNDTSVRIDSIPSLSTIIVDGFESPILRDAEYHYQISDDSGRGEVTIHWEESTNTEFEILQYHISIYGNVLGVEFSTDQVVGATDTSAFFTGIPNNHILNVSLYASNALSNSLSASHTIRIIVPPKKLLKEDMNLIQGNQQITVELLPSYVDDSLLNPIYLVVSYKRQNSIIPYSDEIVTEITNTTNTIMYGLENGYNYDFKCIVKSSNNSRSTGLIVSQYPIDTITSGTTLFNISRSVDGNSLLFVF